MKLLRTDLAVPAWPPLVAAAIALVAGRTASGADRCPAPAPSRASRVEHRQFDFWVGHWDVFGPAGKKVGENRIELIADGCALLEQWTGDGGVTGKSLNIYDARRSPLAPDLGRQQRHAADARPASCVDRSMVMSMTGPSPTEPARRPCCSGSPGRRPADGSVRQLWELSSDAGKTWTVLFDGRYVRAR